MSGIASLVEELIRKIKEKSPADELREIIESGACVNFACRQGLAPLHHACYQDVMENVQLIISYGCDLNAKDDVGHTALHICARFGRYDVMELLIKNGANVNEKDSLDYYGDTLIHRPSLHLALQYAQLDCAELLLESGAETNVFYPNVGYEIHLVRAKNVKGLELLLRYGADPDKPNWDGCTMLHLCCIDGNLAFVQALVEYGANINASIQGAVKGVTPLYCAVHHGHFSIASYLLEQGALVDVEPVSMYLPPLHQAVSDGRDEMAALLLEYGANIHVKDASANQAIHLSVNFRNNPDRLKCLSVLVPRGSNVNSVNSVGLTPLAILLTSAISAVGKPTDQPDDVLSTYITLLVNRGAKVNMTLDSTDPYNVLQMLEFFLPKPECCDALISSADVVDTCAGTDTTIKIIDDGLRDLLKYLSTNPRTLQHLARRTIRGCLKKYPLEAQVSELPLPRILKNYLLYC